jgi:hypothetical protein
VTYMRLHEALEFAANKKANEDGKSQSLEFFLKSFDRGSSPYRKILQLTEIARWKIENLKLWFLGILPGMIDSNLFVNAVISLSNFLIWECKLRKEITPAGTLIENLLASVKKCLYISSALRTVKNKTNLFVCRHISDPP